MMPLLVTSGEPAGIGPDLCLELAGSKIPLVVVGDKQLLAQRAQQLGRKINLYDYKRGEPFISPDDGLVVWHIPCVSEVVPGRLDVRNASYVLDMLKQAVTLCLQNEFSAIVTAPLHKGIINKSGIYFTGHTEFFAEQCGVDNVVMMLACDSMKVGLVTTHLPLRRVADQITQSLIIDVIQCLHTALQQDFRIKAPRIWVAGLNPHAGEGGYLGTEEIDIIIPALEILRAQAIDVQGPFSADTLFTPKNLPLCDVFVAMYHDQGLPVLKYAGFGNAVNVTLGLPIIRTSVDHGTALELAGTGLAQASSLISAVTMTTQMVMARSIANGN